MKKTTFIAVCAFALWTALALPAVLSSVQAAKGGGVPAYRHRNRCRHQHLKM